jgi:hypothetical protein
MKDPKQKHDPRPNAENWTSTDFDRTWDYGSPRGTDRDLPPDRGFEHDRSPGVFRDMQKWDRRPDGEREPSEFGGGSTGREWEHSEEFDRKGEKGKY